MITVKSFTSFIFAIVIGHDDFFFLLTVLNEVQLRGSFTCINNAVAIYFTGTAIKMVVSQATDSQLPNLVAL